MKQDICPASAEFKEVTMSNTQSYNREAPIPVLKYSFSFSPLFDAPVFRNYRPLRRRLGPVRNTRIFVFFIAKKSVNRKPYLGERFYDFTPTEILSTVTKRQRCRREYLEAYNFLLGDKFLLSLTAILHQVILFRKYDQLKLL